MLTLPAKGRSQTPAPARSPPRIYPPTATGAAGVWLFSLALWPSERSSLWRLCLGGGQLLRVRILQAPSLAVALNEGRRGPGIEQYTQLVQARAIATGCTYRPSRVGRFQSSREGQGGLTVARI